MILVRLSGIVSFAYSRSHKTFLAEIKKEISIVLGPYIPFPPLLIRLSVSDTDPDCRADCYLTSIFYIFPKRLYLSACIHVRCLAAGRS